MAHWMPTLRPVLMQHEARRLVVTNGPDAEQIVHLSLEAPRGERNIGEARQLELIDRQAHVQFHPCIGWSRDEQVHHTHRLTVAVGTVVVSGYQCQAVAALDQFEDIGAQVRGRDLDDSSRRIAQVVHRANTSAAVFNSRANGQIVTPIAAATTRPPTSGMPAATEPA